MTPIAISWSEISRWLRCPRQWFAEYYLGFLPAAESPSGVRNLGIRVHTAMEWLYSPGHEPVDPLLTLAVLYAAEIEKHPDWEKELRADWELSKIMVEGWLKEAQDQGLDANYDVIATEEEVAVPLPGFGGAVLLRGKLDQVVLDNRTGVLSFLDWKTADNFLRSELIEMDPQMKTYSLIQLLAAGHPEPMSATGEWNPGERLPLVAGGIVRTMRRVKRTSRTKPPYYQQHPFIQSPERLAAHLLLIQQAVAEIMNARTALDAGYEQSGGAVNVINHLQQTVARPVEIPSDCSWRCPLSRGMCQLMSGGGSWYDAFVSSGQYVQGDPYVRYSRPDFESVRALIEARDQ